MSLKIQVTGLDQFAPGGNMRLRAVIIGPGDSGKTRFSSYASRPFYAACEAGLGSVADRRVPFANVNTSQDMLDVLEFMATECRRPWEQRRFHTIVVDTVDAFERKVKEEWVRANPAAQTFSGYPAWAYLGSKMQMLLTRLLNLDMNVLVLAHHKDKTIKEGVGELATERQELSIRLQGETKDTIFDDFDLVGWMGTFWEAVDGQRVQKRGLTFKKTPERPFLKDRLDMTPPWIEVTFDESDYAKLFTRLQDRISALAASEELGEIPRATTGFGPPESDMTGVVTPGAGGALPASDPREVPLASRSKTELLTIARELRVEGVKGNTIKSELIPMIEAAGGITAWMDAKEAKAPEPVPEPEAQAPAPEAPAETTAAPEEPVDADGDEVADDDVTEEETSDVVEGEGQAGFVDGPDEPEVEEPAFSQADLDAAAAIPQCMEAKGSALCVFDRQHPGDHSWASPTTEAGEPANTVTGQIHEERAAIAAVKDGVGGKVIARTANKTAPPPPKSVGGAERPEDCPECGKGMAVLPPLDLTDGKATSVIQLESYIRVAWIKYRAHMCATCYLTRKKPA